MELFEGPEKKFEIVVDSSISFRAFSDEYWHELASLAGATVLSSISNDKVRAYLLSESSLFVFDNHVVMITCGRTCLVPAITALLDRVGEENICSLIFERKNEHFPELQPTSFETDVALLQERLVGRSLLFGQSSGNHVSLYHLDKEFQPRPGDMTLELLMHGIDENICDLFSTDDREARDKIAQMFIFDKLFPGFEINDYVFCPSGYSLNAIRSNWYATIHVTPQLEGSYVSFETNWVCNQCELDSMLSQLLGVLKPTVFDVLSFDCEHSLAVLEKYGSKHRAFEQRLECGYFARYAHFQAQRADVSHYEKMERICV